MGPIESFARARGMQVNASGGGALSITVHAFPDLIVDVTVVESADEWFVEVRDGASGEQVFDDWCDHYGQASRDELDRERYETVTAFLSAVQGAMLRVRRSPGSFGVRQLQVRTDAGWRNVWDLT